MRSVMVVCVLYPRFELLAALGDRRALLSEPAALAPEAGREQVVGEVSAPAEAFGVVRGMRLGEAMSRCPALRLVPPDPEGVRSLWNAVLDRLEAIGAQVESDRAGAAFFESGGLRGLHGGDLAGVLAAARRTLGPGARFGAAPCRFAAHAAALQARPPGNAAARSLLCCGGGEPARLPRSAAGLAAAHPARAPGAARGPRAARHPHAGGGGGALRARRRRAFRASGAAGPRSGSRARYRARAAAAPEPVVERLDLPEAASGQQLERALELLVARVLSRRERRGRALRALAVSARFVAGGTWRIVITLRHASADPQRIQLAVGPKLAELPAPAESLALEVEAFGPPAQDQGRLLDEAAAIRRGRLGEAVRQARQAAGSEAALKILEVDSDSRVPERRAVLAPFPDAPSA